MTKNKESQTKSKNSFINNCFTTEFLNQPLKLTITGVKNVF